MADNRFYNFYIGLQTWPALPGDTQDMQIWTSYINAFESYRLTDRQTIYVWSLPVTWQRWRSYHSIRRSRKPHATRIPDNSVCYRTGLSEIGILDVFGSCDLDLDPMTFIYELDLYCLELYWMYKYELPTPRLTKVIVWQTDRHA